MDLFSFVDQSNSAVESGQQSGLQSVQRPLAELMRPSALNEMLGQTRVLGEGSTWRKLIELGQIPSLILWGPPGCGKTTFALLLARQVEAEFLVRNAVDTGARLLREIGEAAVRRRLEFRRKTFLFIDEIHRLNKAQQDVLLPFVERGDVVLIGATTENPSYEINNALLSRCRVVVFERLSLNDLRDLLSRTFQRFGLSVVDALMSDAQDRLLELADGDARRLLNMCEILLNVGKIESRSCPPSPLTPEELAKLLDSPTLNYDRGGDAHYDTISAFIKSIRGSSPDAAIYYLARMIKGGEDPVFIARRLVVLASEDVGNADPRALTMAVAGLQAVELVGWPEAAINLAQVVTYLASAPKSNRSYLALKSAQAEVEQSGNLPVPLALRSAKAKAMKDLGYGKGYKYSHDGDKGFVDQVFLPAEIASAKFYEPTDRGFEKNIRQYLEWMKA